MSTKQEEMELGTAQPETTAVDKYEFEPIQGYPMLNWRGKRPFRSTQYYPAQLKEVHGPEVDGWRNKIYWGDNLQVMSHLLKEYRGKVDLIYVDPPFDSKADYKKKVSIKTHTATSERTTFEEKQYTDIWTNDEYLQFMYERIVLMRELLSETGTIYIHCDWRKSHHLRNVMDEVFGSNNCLGEIAWKRSPFAGSSKARSNKFPVNHDTIMYYSKSADYQFSHDYMPYSEDYLSRFKNTDNDPNGPYRITSLKTYSNETFERLKEEGRLIPPKKSGAGWSYKQYLKDSKGVQADDIWSDLNLDNPMSNTRTGYPTQKPESLLNRIIKCSSSNGGLVFDCFMGSGTTQSVAMKLGRRFIGADINLGAIQTTTKRLINIAKELEAKQSEPREDGKLVTYYTGFEVYNVNHYDVFRNPLEAKDLLIEALEIQKLEANNLYDGEKDGRMVKIMPVNRIATKADLNELISGFDYKAFERRQTEMPNQPVEKLLLVCMGHEADLAATLQNEVNFKLDIEVVDILRDKSNLEFKRDSEAQVTAADGKLVIEQFYPMNLLQKLSLMKENVEDWRELVESVMVDWNYDGAVLEPALVDLPGKDELVSGEYAIPEDAGTIRVKITDLLSESLEVEVPHG